MKFDVTITETLEMVVSVEAGNRSEAEDIVYDKWKNGVYVLGADDFTGVEVQSKEG
jgi:hypothetical protein